METEWEGVGPTQAVSMEVESATSTEENDVIVNSAHNNVNPINTTNYQLMNLNRTVKEVEKVNKAVNTRNLVTGDQSNKGLHRNVSKNVKLSIAQ